MFSMKDGKEVDAHLHDQILDNPKAEATIRSARLRRKAEKREMMAKHLREITMGAVNKPGSLDHQVPVDQAATTAGAPPGIKLVPVDYDPFKDQGG